jgi:Kef-type K+ transport system membrane component KefB
MLPFLQFILAIAIIITAAKVGGYLSSRLGQPAVTGELVTGLILGPSVLDFFQWPTFTDPHLGESITHLAELGVLLLMFIAGLGLHLSDLAKERKVAVMAGILGFALPLGMGFVLAIAFSLDLHQALFLGLMLAPTSIGISAQTLMELQALRGRVAVGLLGAAVVDDILVVLGISLFLAFLGGGAVGGLTTGVLVLLRMILYLAAASAIGIWLVPRLSILVEKLPISQGLIAFAFVTLLLFSWSAEVLGSMASIIGAFLAGLFFARSPLKERIANGFLPLAYGVFVPIFFVNVGLSANLRQLSTGSLGLFAAVIIVAIISKVLGSGLAGRLGGLKGQEALQLGVGMIPRGEVTLIVATIGMTEGVIGMDLFSVGVGVAVVTTLLTPPLLRYAFAWASSPNVPTQESS